MYLQLDEGFDTHRKTLALGRLMQNPEAGIYMVRLWMWAIRSAPDGNLDGMESFDIETVVKYRPLDGKLFAAMVKAGFIDDVGGEIRIHNWETRTGASIKRLTDDSARKKRYRDHKSRTCGGLPCEFCLVDAGAPAPERRMSTDESRTVLGLSAGHPVDKPTQNRTEQNRTEQEEEKRESVSLAGNAPPAKALPKLKRRITPRPEPVYGELFERIWADTGRSGNKFPAFEAWLANGSPPANEVLDGWRHAQRHDRRWRGSDPHIPHLSTWLNDLGWRDRPSLNGGTTGRVIGSPAEQIQAMQAKEREEREYRRRSDEAAAQIAAEVDAALREAEATVNQ